MKKCKIDRLGRIVIPKHYRDAIGASENSLLSVEYVDGKILITAVGQRCCICTAFIDNGSDFPLCKGCIKKIREME